MSERLAAARSMSFTAQVTYEASEPLGPALAFTTISEVLMQRPDKLRVMTLGDGPASEFYYDGKTMTAFSPAENSGRRHRRAGDDRRQRSRRHSESAASTSRSPTCCSPTPTATRRGPDHAFYIGQSKVVGGTTTDMVAFVNDEVFVQIWIGAEDKLPRMLRAVYRRDPLRLRHQMELSNWKLDPVVAASDFTTAKSASAVAIPFAHPAAKPAAAAAARSQ
jgi:hypothetical protein